MVEEWWWFFFGMFFKKGEAMNIDPLLFEDNESFREMLPALKEAGMFKPEQEHEAWGVRAYVLSEGVGARNPPAMWAAKMQKKDYGFISEQHWRQGTRDRDGKSALPTALSREKLIEEAKRHVGDILPDGAEILNMGTDSKDRGLMSWEKFSDEELQRIVAILRGSERGETPRFLSPQQAAKALGYASMSEALHETPSR